MVEALMLAPYCGGVAEPIEAILRGRVGEEEWQRTKVESACILLGREVVGAFGGKWQLDTVWVKHLLEAGADVNMLLDLGDSTEAEDDWGDGEDSAIQQSSELSQSEMEPSVVSGIREGRQSESSRATRETS
mmetsp:Transcript_82127/g.259166  ORF Transcript_82127/g.259166 Transcript_82127/m.259166 type:complete len:132 (-) Transcript_82127:65-460(-)